MIKVINKIQTRFRIQIYDLKEKKSKTIRLTDSGNYKVEDLQKMIVDCLNKK